MPYFSPRRPTPHIPTKPSLNLRHSSVKKKFRFVLFRMSVKKEIDDDEYEMRIIMEYLLKEQIVVAFSCDFVVAK